MGERTSSNPLEEKASATKTISIKDVPHPEERPTELYEELAEIRAWMDWSAHQPLPLSYAPQVAYS